MKSADDIIRSLIKAVQDLGEATFTESVAEQLEQQLRLTYGGQSVYIQKVDRDARRDAVLRDFDGRNRKELCARYGLSKAQFYRMLKGG
ncbi:MAG: hypothetical protein H6R10_710 [Rhodocyclaceae bacterium]|nr:hypothetical protein [Rhodocyclaceae bacterium]